MTGEHYHNVHLPEGVAIPTIPKVASSSIFQALKGQPATRVDLITQDQLEGREIVNLVRDPLDRLVSLYRWRKETWWNDMSFEEYLEWVCSKPDDQSDKHFRSQTGLLTTPDGRLLVGRVFAYDQIEQFWTFVRSRSGVGPLGVRNESDKRPVDLTARQKSLVYSRYADDYALLRHAV